MVGGEDGSGEAPALGSKGSAFQVIVLGSGGGPNEDNITGLLVRSTAHHWVKDSVLALDAGTHLASIIRILEEQLPTPRHEGLAADIRHISPSRRKPSDRSRNGTNSPISPLSQLRTANGTKDDDSIQAPPKPSSENLPITLHKGPFAGLELPHQTAKANAAFINRELVSTYLITHPHLDHISGFVVNTASFQHTNRPKRLAALPTTIDAIKNHVFNDIIWPNLTDEDGGVGLVTFMRLDEGGNLALGEGEGQGYIEVCDGLGVKGWSISHGTCMKRHHHRGSGDAGLPDEPHSANGRLEGRSTSIRCTRGEASMPDVFPSAAPQPCVTDSTAYFIRDQASGREILIFGDVEPDSISLSPRTARVWAEAAPKIAAGILTGIFIECSYDDSQRDEILFGHLNPRHLVAELKVLAKKVEAVRREKREREVKEAGSKKKRKRASVGLVASTDPDVGDRRGRNPHQGRVEFRSDDDDTEAVFEEVGPDCGGIAHDDDDKGVGAREAAGSGPAGNDEATSRISKEEKRGALHGVGIFILHVKDTLRDGAPAGDVILRELRMHEREAGLGCVFEMSRCGGSYFL